MDGKEIIQRTRENVMLSDEEENKIKLLVFLVLKHSGGSIMLWYCHLIGSVQSNGLNRSKFNPFELKSI